MMIENGSSFFGLRMATMSTCFASRAHLSTFSVREKVDNWFEKWQNGRRLSGRLISTQISARFRGNIFVRLVASILRKMNAIIPRLGLFFFFLLFYGILFRL